MSTHDDHRSYRHCLPSVSLLHPNLIPGKILKRINTKKILLISHLLSQDRSTSREAGAATHRTGSLTTEYYSRT